MIPLVFIYLVVLCTRLCYFYHEKPLSLGNALKKSGIESGVLFIVAMFQADFRSAMLEDRLLLLGLFFLALNLWSFRSLRRAGQRNAILTIQCLLICLSFVGMSNSWGDVATPDTVITPLFYLIGAVICLNEINVLFRWLMNLLELKGEQESDVPVDRAEYNRGRLIGMLERLLIFMMAASGQYTAIGFVLALKAAIRFPELKERVFAEYVLIGTLLSTILAIVVALSINLLLGVI